MRIFRSDPMKLSVLKIYDHFELLDPNTSVVVQVMEAMTVGEMFNSFILMALLFKDDQNVTYSCQCVLNEVAQLMTLNATNIRCLLRFPYDSLLDSPEEHLSYKFHVPLRPWRGFETLFNGLERQVWRGASSAPSDIDESLLVSSVLNL